jgi:parvulin-like peptidyl-prolyl isomerase
MNVITEIESTVAFSLRGAKLSLPEFLAHLARRGRLRPLLLESFAEMALRHECRQAGISVSTEELQRATDGFRYRQGLTGAAETQRWLTGAGLSPDDFEAALEHDLLVDKFKRERLEPRVAPHFAVHRDGYARVQFQQIVVESAEIALELLARIREEGEDFAAVVRSHSRPGTAPLGLVPRYAMPDVAADAMFAAKPGDIVGPVATDQGYHLFLVEALEEPVLDDSTAALIRDELFDAWLHEQLKDVRIDTSFWHSA